MEPKTVKSFGKKHYVCPHCGEKQTQIIEWQTISAQYYYDFTKKRWSRIRKTEGGDHETWNCPGCGEELIVPEKLWENIFG